MTERDNYTPGRERETCAIRDAILDSKLGVPFMISPATAIILAQEIWEALHSERLTRNQKDQ